MNVQQEIAQEAIKLLIVNNHLQASWKYPGFILIRMPELDADLCVGTVNGHWAPDVIDGDGQPIEIPAEFLVQWEALEKIDPEFVSPAVLARLISVTYFAMGDAHVGR